MSTPIEDLMARFERVEQRIDRLEGDNRDSRRLLYGYWEDTERGKERVPGVLELMAQLGSSIDQTLKEIKERDNEWAAISKTVKRVAGWVVTPVLGLIGIALFLSFVNWASHVNWTQVQQAPPTVSLPSPTPPHP